jgi:DNA-binding NtrC family response regulator
MKTSGAILVVDDEESVRESLASWLEEDGYQVDTAPDGRTALAMLGRQTYAVLLVDLKMPGLNGLQVLSQARTMQPQAAVILMTAYATVDTAVQAMKQGAYDYLMKPFEPEVLSQMVGHLTQAQTLGRENPLMRSGLTRQIAFKGMVSRSLKMEAVFELARTAAQSDSPVLLVGETGTGKELLARAIHGESSRKAGPFVVVSCSVAAEALLESTLFGLERGAAADHAGSIRGTLELAAGGTVFLDEIGAITPKVQQDLLQVLDVREFRRVGGSQVIRADARIIATTSRDLKRAVESGAFREDLFDRLNGIRIMLPPLRDRKEDIPVLAEQVLGLLQTEIGRTLEGVSAEALELLSAYDWPGNVGELRTVLERGAAQARGTILTPMDLDVTLPTPQDAGRPEPGESLKEVERRHIEASLREFNWNISRTARALGIDRVTLYNKIKRYQLRAEG